MKDLVKKGTDANGIYDALTQDDIGRALDLFRPTYDRTNGEHGFVSLEVSPTMAHSTEETTAEALRLWKSLNRPNAMIKIPGTDEGLPAIEEALFQGVNINVTLLFSVDAYEKVAHTYIKALKRRAEAGLPVDRIASVASFFVSRIDVEVDKRIDARLKEESDPAKKAELEALKGKIAIANAKNAYASFQKIFAEPDFQALKAKGARVQRPSGPPSASRTPTTPTPSTSTS